MTITNSPKLAVHNRRQQAKATIHSATTKTLTWC